MDAMVSVTSSLVNHFSDIEDPRVEARSCHKLVDIIVVTICAVICGAESWYDVEEYGARKVSFLRQFLELRHGPASHDTYRRVFTIVNPEKIGSCFVYWVKSLVRLDGTEVIAIDGKTIRRSFDRSRGQTALHMVSAWATESGLVLAQKGCGEKQGEVKVIPELLEVLNVKNAIVTIDAAGCQKSIAKQIVDQGGDYVLALKGNQGLMHEDVQSLFSAARKSRWRGYSYDWFETTESGHGRTEKRRYWTIEQRPNHDHTLERWGEDTWAGLNTIGMVESTRKIGTKTTTEVRYFLSSIENNAESLAKAVRGHWGIENGLNWVLDVVFREDEDRNRTGHAQSNLALVRRIAINLIKQETTSKRSLKGKRKAAAWDDQYLLTVLKSKPIV